MHIQHVPALSQKQEHPVFSTYVLQTIHVHFYSEADILFRDNKLENKLRHHRRVNTRRLLGADGQSVLYTFYCNVPLKFSCIYMKHKKRERNVTLFKRGKDPRVLKKTSQQKEIYVLCSQIVTQLN